MGEVYSIQVLSSTSTVYRAGDYVWKYRRECYVELCYILRSDFLMTAAVVVFE